MTSVVWVESARRFVPYKSTRYPEAFTINRVNAGRRAKFLVDSWPGTYSDGSRDPIPRTTVAHSRRSAVNRVGPRTITGASENRIANNVAAPAIFHCRFQRK